MFVLERGGGGEKGWNLSRNSTNTPSPPSHPIAYLHIYSSFALSFAAARVDCAMTATVAWLLPNTKSKIGWAGNLAEGGCIQTLQMDLEYPIAPAHKRVTGSYHSRNDQAPITATLTTRKEKGSKRSWRLWRKA
ncbi:Protein of unknown function [Pyronema omphalodes CBS 100304]|uniref:Uncharacterized protein n=1 Tax=Pyronema omphalodes (strain CBS 100304) TaxID=1076935 RepID=U4LB51_PYROM|nr:Protein of unknown function [Pyronema omphalodes CBS 100304]